jgi:hypothetical protein
MVFYMLELMSAHYIVSTNSLVCLKQPNNPVGADFRKVSVCGCRSYAAAQPERYLASFLGEGAAESYLWGKLGSDHQHSGRFSNRLLCWSSLRNANQRTLRISSDTWR